MSVTSRAPVDQLQEILDAAVVAIDGIILSLRDLHHAQDLLLYPDQLQS
jgi:hypothetical protein